MHACLSQCVRPVMCTGCYRFVLVLLDFRVDLNLFVCVVHACLYVYQAVAELCLGWTARNVTIAAVPR